MKKVWFIVSIVLFVMIQGCMTSKKIVRFQKVENRWVKVMAPSENVREKPNGRVIGKMFRGDSLLVKENFGNWLRFTYKNHDAYIWAPSCGFKYINLYSPFTYIDTLKKQIIPFDEFKRLLGSRVDTVGGTSKLMQLEFKNLGLGEERQEILDVAKVYTQKVEKGIGIWYDVQKGLVNEVYIDLLRPVYGIKNALKKAGLPSNTHVYKSDNSQIVIKLYPDANLYFILKRKEWKSKVISGFKITYQY